jgi:hypothetical protein
VGGDVDAGVVAAAEVEVEVVVVAVVAVVVVAEVDWYRLIAQVPLLSLALSQSDQEALTRIQKSLLLSKGYHTCSHPACFHHSRYFHNNTPSH